MQSLPLSKAFATSAAVLHSALRAAVATTDRTAKIANIGTLFTTLPQMTPECDEC